MLRNCASILYGCPSARYTDTSHTSDPGGAPFVSCVQNETFVWSLACEQRSELSRGSNATGDGSNPASAGVDRASLSQIYGRNVGGPVKGRYGTSGASSATLWWFVVA